MPQASIPRGNELYDWVIQPTALVWSAATVASTTAELTTTIPGLQLGDLVQMSLNAALVTGLSYTNIRVSAANTLAVTWVAASVTATVPTGTWTLIVVRPEAPANLPASAA